MKRSSYMASNEMTEYMWLSAVRQIFEKLLDTTQDKTWRKKIKTADTMIRQVIEDRDSCFDDLERQKAYRRVKQTGIKVYSYVDARFDKDHIGRTKTISQEDFFDLADAAIIQCRTCPQGDLVKDCPRRKMFHRLGFQVHQLRENPAPGECEFRTNNKQEAITPQYQLLDTEILEQMP